MRRITDSLGDDGKSGPGTATICAGEESDFGDEFDGEDVHLPEKVGMA